MLFSHTTEISLGKERKTKFIIFWSIIDKKMVTNFEKKDEIFRYQSSFYLHFSRENDFKVNVFVQHFLRPTLFSPLTYSYKWLILSVFRGIQLILLSVISYNALSYISRTLIISGEKTISTDSHR